MSVFSDPRIAELSKAFLPAADEVWRLQRGGDAECQFFQRAVNGGKLITDNGTRQGIYVMAPSGEVLARVNSLKADRVLQMMQEGLAAWEALPEERRHLASDTRLEGEERWEDSRPTEGLLLSRIVRDLPVEGTVDGTRATRWNRDTLWFSKEEVEQLVKDARDRPADWVPLPRAFARRLACFTFVDNVYGQCIPFDMEDVTQMQLEVRWESEDDDNLHLRFRGRTAAAEDGEWRLGENLWKPKNMHAHALETTMLGSGTFDLHSRSFVAFEMLALGRRSGFTELNSRRFRPEPGGIGFLIQLDRRAWSAAPTFIALYEADWVKPPTKGRELTKD
ncbi:MAG: hypothetical protein ACPG31_00400 [Planctomycetota bacterium]